VVNRSRGPWIGLAAIAAVTLVAYWPSLSVPFQFDDYARISGNWNLRAGNWFRGIGQLGGSRVLPASTLAFNFWLSGDETWSYHALNLAIHLAACVAVFRLAWLIARTPRLRDSSAARHPLAFATVAAAWFACHPLQTQAVTYIIQRTASMAAMFYIACVGAYLAGRMAQSRGDGDGRRSFVAATLFALAALLSKENAVTLPLAIALVEVGCFGRRDLRRLARAGAMAAPLLAVPVIWKIVAWRWRGVPTEGGIMRQVLVSVFAQGVDAPGSIGPLDYLLTQMLVLPRYLQLALLPVGLNVDHDVRIATGLDAGVALGLLLLAGLVGGGLWCLRHVPLVGLGILWFFIALSVESSLIPIHDVMMEHRVYLGMPGLSLLAGGATAWLSDRNRLAARASAAAAVALLAGLTFARNQDWQSALSLWSDAAEKSPRKARVHVNVGVAHHVRDELDLAIASYCRAIELDPDIALAAENIEVALEQQGRLDAVMAELKPRRIDVPGTPDGAFVLEYDLSEVVCAE
jgi:hypothetical protein